MSFPEAVIFDFDGVIVDSEREKFNFLKKSLKARGIKLAVKDFPYFIGRKRAKFLEEKFGSVLSSRDIRRILRESRLHQVSNPWKYAKLTSGVKDFIFYLENKRVPAYISSGTGKPLVNKYLKLNGLDKHIDVLVTGEEISHSKPHPEIYRASIKKLGIPRDKLLVIEDSPAGILAAKKIGLRVAAITSTQTRSMLRGADLVVNSFNEIKKVLCAQGSF